MHIIQSAIQLLPVILLMCLGYLFKKYRLFNQKNINGIKKMVINVTLPSLIFLALSQVKFELEFIYIYAAVLVIWLLILFAGKALGNKIGLSSFYFPFLVTGGEGSMFGFAIFGATFGADKIQYFAVINMVNAMFFNFIILPQLLQYRSNAMDVKSRLRALATSPMIWSVILGLAASSMGIESFYQHSAIGEAMQRTFTLLSQPTIPLIAMIMGFELSFSLHHLRAPVKTVLIRLMLYVPIGLLLNTFMVDRWLHYGHLIQGAFLTLWLLPPSFSVPVFLKDTDEVNREYVLNTISIYIIVSFIFYTFLV